MAAGHCQLEIVFGRHVCERRGGYVPDGKLSLKDVRKASLVPAQILETSVPQMKNRGPIKVGADADIVVFDPATVSDRTTYEKPNQTFVGFQHVL